MSPGIQRHLAAVRAQVERLQTELALLDAAIRAAEDREYSRELSAALDVVSERMALPRERIVSRQQETRVAWARMLACWLAHQVGGLSAVAIAREMERDRTTIVYGLQKIEARRASDREFSARAEAMKDDVRTTLFPTARRAA